MDMQRSTDRRSSWSEPIEHVATSKDSFAVAMTVPAHVMWARCASEELPVASKVSKPQPVMYKRVQSEPDLGGENRHEKVHVLPQDQAYLHTLHEAMVRDRGGRFFDEKSVIPPKALDNWGRDGSWHVQIELPPGSNENGFTIRPLKVLPTVRDVPTFLKEQGVGVVNSKGLKGNDRTFGQDSCSISRLAGGWEVFCVMDGHGCLGHWPAYHSTRALPYVLENNPGCVQMLKQGKVSAALCHAFDKVEANLVYESIAKDIDIQVAGCTASCLVLHESYGMAWIATAGDTRALLLDPSRGVVGQTRDHKPSVPEEHERLVRMGCDVETTEHADGFVEERVNIAGVDFPGLGMSRSLGDLVLKDRGVTHEPEVIEWQLEGLQQAFIVMASDGVWEFMKSEQVATVVLEALEQGSSCQEAANLLLQRARSAWAHHEDNYCDDITVIVVPIRRERPTIRKPQSCGCCAGLRQMLNPIS